MPASVVAECAIADLARIESCAQTLPEAERRLADGFTAPARRAGFLAGRLALHAALEEAGFAAAEEPVLRDPRGRPVATFAGAPPLSIAHSKRRAIAIVATSDACAAIGVDVEEIDERHAEALRRMALSADELARLREVDPPLLEAPLAAWCAREACVKAHALEVGWFGTALVVDAIGSASAGASTDAGPEPCWRIDLRFDPAAQAAAPAGFTGASALVWREDGAIRAVCVRSVLRD